VSGKKGIRQKSQRFFELDGRSRGLLLLSALLLPLFWLRVRLLRRGRLGAAVSPTAAPESAASSEMRSELAHIGRLVNIAAAQVLPEGSCLTRAVFLQWLLLRRGIVSDLRIGVQLQGGALLAHAWVEYAGVPINDVYDVAERYAPFGRGQAPQVGVSP
jgi:hypothetical protein